MNDDSSPGPAPSSSSSSSSSSSAPRGGRGRGGGRGGRGGGRGGRGGGRGGKVAPPRAIPSPHQQQQQQQQPAAAAATVDSFLNANAPVFVPAAAASSSSSAIGSANDGTSAQAQAAGKPRGQARFQRNSQVAPGAAKNKSEAKGKAANKSKGGNKAAPKGKGRASLAASSNASDDGEGNDLAVVALEAKGFSALSAQIISKLQRDVYECLVCMDRVRRHNSVWSCAHCFALFHIACIGKWSRRALPDAPVPAVPAPAAGAQLPWRCPGCQTVNVGVPHASCFCGLHSGAVAAAPDDGFLVPHSCGEPCARKRLAARAGVASACEHPCPLQCHPGPCPPCAVMGPLRTCYCGETDQRYRCSDERNVTGQSCGGVCGRKLGCGSHRCQQVCHAGACQPCAVELAALCYCGAHQTTLLCGAGKLAPPVPRADKRAPASSEPLPRAFACGDVCGDALACGRHQCAAACHAGACKPCARAPASVTHCPCGKVRLGSKPDGAPPPPAAPSVALCERTVRATCDAPIPTCGQVCDKPMSCGVHRCARPCHEGACGACAVPQSTTCRCGATTATRPCHEVLGASAEGLPPLLCNTRCPTQLECGRHRCAQLCCAASFNGDPEGVHICKAVCNKKLGCGNHRCRHLCHRDRCPMCLAASFDEWRCPCGGTVVEPPISCGAVMPQCRLPCRKPRACGHVDSLQHPCHEGACPPCAALTQRECVGGHGVVITLPCHAQQALCGGFCKKQLVCQLHRCERRCHGGVCGDAAVEAVAAQLGALEPRPACGSVCKILRASCGHGCAAKCHPGTPCPDVPCAAIAKIACACGRRSIERVCGRTSAAAEAAAEAAASDAADLAAAAAAAAAAAVEGEPQAAVPAEAVPAAAAAVPAVDRIDVLECDEQCIAEQRREQLANAFGIGGRDGKKAPLYSELLRHFALASPVFVRSVERTFHHVVTSKEVAIGGTHRLPPMDKMRRQIVHQLAKHYFLPTESVGEEPFRRVVLTRAADSRLPTMSLGQVAHPHVPNAVGLSALHFSNLTPNVRTNHLEALLEPFRDLYRLKWLDDSNALAIFVNEAEARVALRSVKGHSPFDVALFDDLMPTLYGGGTLSLSIDKDDAATTGSFVPQDGAALRRSSNSPPPAKTAPALQSGWAQVAKAKQRVKPGAADSAFND